MSYPYFNNFILDGIVLLVSIALVVLAAIVVINIGQILYALLRAFLDKFRNKKQ